MSTPLQAGGPTSILILLVVTMVLLFVVIIMESVAYLRSAPVMGSTGPTGSMPTGNSGGSSPNTINQYGAGEDGDLVITGETIALTRNMLCANVVLNNATLYTNGWCLYASQQFQTTGASFIICKGQTGGGNTGSVPSAAGLGGTGGLLPNTTKLAGGTPGGVGYFQFHDALQNAQSNYNQLWANDSSLFIGADGVSSSYTLNYPIGFGGMAGGIPARATADLQMALDPYSKPIFPLLAGGNGGGGGQGTLTKPGSGGGGGAGIVLVGALSVIIPAGSLTVDVSGGAAGQVYLEGPAQATSGGGGSGGSFILSTLSPPSLYPGLTVLVNGGTYQRSDGTMAQANNGMYLNYFYPQAGIAALNPQQQLINYSTTTQPLDNNVQTTLAIETDTVSSGVRYYAGNNRIQVTLPGTYLISCNAPTDTSPGVVSAWIRVNGVDAPNWGLCGNQSDILINALVPLNALDYFDIQMYQNSGSTVNIEATSGRRINLSVVLSQPSG
jgi:lipoprotein-anchoring transpeptidase ErfK/SrfK